MANTTKNKHGSKEPESPSTLTIDVEHYQAYLDDMDIPDEKKRELVETIYSIVMQFVELGFGITTTHQALEAQKKHPRKQNSRPKQDSDTIPATMAEKENA